MTKFPRLLFLMFIAATCAHAQTDGVDANRNVFKNRIETVAPLNADAFTLNPLNENGWRGTFYYKGNSTLPYAIFLEKMISNNSGYAIDIHPVAFQNPSWKSYLDSQLADLSKTSGKSAGGIPDYDKKAAEKYEIEPGPMTISHSKPIIVSNHQGNSCLRNEYIQDSHAKIFGIDHKSSARSMVYVCQASENTALEFKFSYGYIPGEEDASFESHSDKAFGLLIVNKTAASR